MDRSVPSSSTLEADWVNMTISSQEGIAVDVARLQADNARGALTVGVGVGVDGLIDSLDIPAKRLSENHGAIVEDAVRQLLSRCTETYRVSARGKASEWGPDRRGNAGYGDGCVSRRPGGSGRSDLRCLTGYCI